MTADDDVPTLSFASGDAWADWLAAHAAASPGVWLRLARKGSGSPSVTKAEALDLALRYGWIDGQVRSLDAGHWLQRFAPRGPRSKWSQVNRARALELIDLGLMQPQGLAAVAAAQADGRWERAYAPQSSAAVPADLAAALAQSPAAAASFARLDSRNRYAVLHRLEDAQRPETRARRIERFVAMLERGETLHP